MSGPGGCPGRGPEPHLCPIAPTMPQKSRQNRNRKRKATLKLVKRMIAREEQELSTAQVPKKEASGGTEAEAAAPGARGA